MSLKTLNKKNFSPNLNTIIMVEETIKNLDSSIIKISELKRQLLKQINHNTLKNILEYLEYSNKIYVGMKGITWIFNQNPNLKKAINEGLEV